MFEILAALLLFTILGFPSLLCGTVLSCLGLYALPVCVVLFPVAQGILAGLLSRPFHWSIQPGKFRRDVGEKLYRARRLYGLCWTSLYYTPALLHLFLAFRPLKRALTWSFGCPAAVDATFYPDTWLRDLPVLELGKGAYLANKATIGTNMVMTNGFILVGKVTVDEGAVVGHLAGIGPGSKLGARSEMAFRSAIGMRSRIGADARVGSSASIGHGTIVGDGVVIGPHCFLGNRCHVADGLVIPGGTIVPDRSTLRTQADVDGLRGKRGDWASRVQLALAG